MEGRILAVLKNGVLSISLQDIPAERFRIYAPEEITAVSVNGEARSFRKDETCYPV